jgi:hypothetical protein
MTDRDSRRRERQARRWPVHIHPLGTDSSDDLSDELSAEARIALVWTLSARMWELTGEPWPTYSRGEMPVTVVRVR